MGSGDVCLMWTPGGPGGRVRAWNVAFKQMFTGEHLLKAAVTQVDSRGGPGALSRGS